MLTRLRKVDQLSNPLSHQKQVSKFRNRIATLEASSIRAHPLIKIMLEDMQHRLDGIEAGAPRSTQATQR